MIKNAKPVFVVSVVVLASVLVGVSFNTGFGRWFLKNDFKSFDVVTEKVKDLDISFCKFKDIRGISIDSSEHKYNLKLFFHSRVERNTWFGFNETFVLPPEEPIGAVIVLDDEDDSAVVKLDTSILYEDGSGRDYAMLGDKARVDLFADTNGKLTKVSVVHFLTQNGAKDFLKYSKSLKADRDSDNES